jgi:hypothetical protein
MRPGIYGGASVPASWEQTTMSAYLWAGEGFRVSHRSAARLHDLEGCHSDAIDLSSVRDMRTSDKQVHLYRVNEDLQQRSKRIRNMECTDIARTLIDLGAVEPLKIVEVALDDAIRRGLVSLDYLQRRLTSEGGRGRSGTSMMRRLLRERFDFENSESIFNTRCARVLRGSPLPFPQSEWGVLGERGFIKRVDFAYPDAKVAIEAHSRRWHTGLIARQESEWHNALVEAGWVVLYFLWSDLKDNGRGFIRRLSRVLWERGAAIQPSFPTERGLDEVGA